MKRKPLIICKNGEWYYKFDNGAVLKVWSKGTQELLSKKGKQ